MLHITDVKASQNRISTSREKALHAAAEDNVLQGPSSHQKWHVAEAIVDLAAFNVKATISAFNVKAAISIALQHVKNAKQALHMSASSSQGLSRRLRKARQSLEEGVAEHTDSVLYKHWHQTCCDCHGRH